MPSLILLGPVAARVRELEVTCARCDREWAVELGAELADRGPDAPVHEVWDGLNADCPQREAPIYTACHLRATALSGMG